MTKPVNVQKATPTELYAKKAPYSSVSNDVVAMIVNPDALAIWIYLQTRSSDWKVIASYLQERFSIGRDRYWKAMACLKELGLMSHEVIREEGTGKMLGKRIIVHYEPNLQVSEHSADRSDGGPSIRETDHYSIKDSSTELSEKKPTVAKAPGKADVNSDFARFWSVYPNKKAKGDAEKAWAKIKPDQSLAELIVTAVMAHRLSADWKKDGGQFIPHPATWLNGKRWEDEVTPATDQPKAKPKSSGPDFDSTDWRTDTSDDL